MLSPRRVQDVLSAVEERIGSEVYQSFVASTSAAGKATEDAQIVATKEERAVMVGGRRSEVQALARQQNEALSLRNSTGRRKKTWWVPSSFPLSRSLSACR